MSLDIIHGSFAAQTGGGDFDEDMTLAQNNIDLSSVATSLADNLGGDVTQDDLSLLLSQASNLTSDQAIAYVYQMLSLVDDDATTGEIELDGDLTFTEALGTALGLSDEGDSGFNDDLFGQTGTLGNIASVFENATVTFEGEDTEGTDDDIMELDFGEADGATLSSAFEAVDDNAMSVLGFGSLEESGNTVLSWGYIPSDNSDPDAGGEYSYVEGDIAEFQTVSAAGNNGGGSGGNGGNGGNNNNNQQEEEEEEDM